LRKLHKKTLTELFATLKEANAELMKPENSAVIGELVKSINEFAEVIKNYISANVSDENENKETAINAFEVYSEKLSVDINETLFKNLKGQLHSIEIQIDKFRVTQFEIVFIVSSAAKSDSLLPVYEAAAADPACVAHWIPVPLFKINEKREIISKTFDGPDKYPGIDCTDYKNYNFAQIRPDVIVVNDIFDNNNFVSELPKMFWVSNLKKFTDCLVYIPYFVFGVNTLSDDFVRDAGLEFTDLVFVESEFVKDYYIKANRPVYEDNFDYSKFIALGSPKIDSAILANERFNNGELEIPEDWRRKIYRDDGSKKTVLFLNTSLQKLFSDVKENDPSYIPGSDYVSYIKYVIEILSKNKDVVILWRPHPLLIDSIKSMRPWLLESLLEIVENYKNSNIGIYDDNGNLNTAIAVSDGLFGDLSSIGVIFWYLKKKLITENKFLRIGSPKLNCAPAVRCCGEIYLKSFYNSQILRFDTSSGKMHFEGFLDGDERKNDNKHMFAVSHNEKIYYLPANSKDIVVYNPKNGETEHFELDIDYHVITRIKCNRYFRNGFFYKDKLFLIPSHYDAIISYDFVNKKQELCLDIGGILSSISYPEQDMIFLRLARVSDDRVVLPFVSTNDVLVYCLTDNSYNLLKIGTGTGFLDVINYNGKLILIEANQLIIWVLDEELNIISSFTDFPPDFRTVEHKLAFSAFTTALVKNNLFLFSYNSNMSVKINLETMKAERILTLDKYISDNDTVVFTLAFYDEKVNKIYISKRTGQNLLEFDPDTLTVNELSLRVEKIFDDESIQYFTNKIIGKVIAEDVLIKPRVGPCAERIYEYIKDRAML
jgi:hypothetical protein